MSMKSSFVRIALVGATFLAIAACGNKGPLVMPQKPVPVEAQPAATPPVQDVPAPQADQSGQSSDGTPSTTKDGGGQ